MGKRKRGRSVKRNLNQNVEPEEIVQAPHSFVIHKGLTGGNTLELTKDFRRVMEPFTASSLKVCIEEVTRVVNDINTFVGKEKEYYKRFCCCSRATTCFTFINILPN